MREQKNRGSFGEDDKVEAGIGGHSVREFIFEYLGFQWEHFIPKNGDLSVRKYISENGVIQWEHFFLNMGFNLVLEHLFGNLVVIQWEHLFLKMGVIQWARAF